LNGDPILTVTGLRVRLPTPSGYVAVVNDVDYLVRPREVFGVAGESGSGKTMSVLALLGLLPTGASVEGSASYGGRDLLRLSPRERRSVNGQEIAMIFQDPMMSLHPMLTIGRQLTEHMRQHLHLTKRQADARAAELLDQVRIPNPRVALHAFAHQFSGGMRQRIAIASALACEPKVLIADEPTTALDVTVQAGILELLDDLRRERGLAIILITHDLGVMSSIADRVSIFYAGRVVESGMRADVLKRPRHPYTRALLDALPHAEGVRTGPLVAIPGSPPSPNAIPPGCPYNPRCAYARPECVEVRPLLEPVDGQHELACHVDPFREGMAA
jgi:oligopeptide/dipeptide ABC transporter ATP-binding protein